MGKFESRCQRTTTVIGEDEARSVGGAPTLLCAIYFRAIGRLASRRSATHAREEAVIGGDSRVSLRKSKAWEKNGRGGIMTLVSR